MTGSAAHCEYCIDEEQTLRQRIAEMHSADSAGYCYECERPWPCATVTLLSSVEASS